MTLFIALFSFCSSIIQAGMLPLRVLSFNHFRQEGLEMKYFSQVQAEYLEMVGVKPLNIITVLSVGAVGT